MRSLLYLKSLQYSKSSESGLIFKEGDIIKVDHKVFKNQVKTFLWIRFKFFTYTDTINF